MSKYLMVPPGFEPDSTSSDSEPEPNQYIIKPSAAPVLLSSSSDDEDSDEPITGSESDSEGTDPMVGMPGGSDSGKKPVVDGKAPEAKRRKSNPDMFNRFFGEDDEIALLTGMLRFAEKFKCGPLANLDAFRKFVKGDLKVDPTTEQLKNKIYKFGSKYKKNLRKETSGKVRRLRAHERRAYELSKLAWANEYIKYQNSSRGQKKRAKGKDDVDLAASGGGPSTAAAADTEMRIVNLDDDSVDKTNGSGIGAGAVEKGKGLREESEWVELMKLEMEVYVKKLELMRTKISHELDVLKSKNC